MSATDNVLALCESIRPLLKGKSPEIQSAALGELLSTFLAGHFVIDPTTREVDIDETMKVRQEVLEGIERLAIQLLPINHAMVMEGHKDRFHERQPRPNAKRR